MRISDWSSDVCSSDLDSAAAAAGKVIDPLFWCMGSWGATYPIAGDIHFDDSVEAWAGLAARGVFMMGRLGALTLSSADGCSFVPIGRASCGYRVGQYG